MSRLPRAELLLPVTVLVAAAALGVSQFMTLFELTPPGSGEPQEALLGTDQHGYALLILAAFAALSTLFAVARGLRAAAFAGAAFGVAALLLFLLIDLPDAGQIGTLEDEVSSFTSVRAEPQLGFWLEAIGAVVLGLAAGALATLNSEQLRTPLLWLTTDQRDPDAPGRRRAPTPEPFDFEAADAAEAKRSNREGRLKKLGKGRRSPDEKPAD